LKGVTGQNSLSVESKTDPISTLDGAPEPGATHILQSQKRAWSMAFKGITNTRDSPSAKPEGLRQLAQQEARHISDSQTEEQKLFSRFARG